MAEIKTAIGQLKNSTEILLFQRSIMLIAFCYSEEELAEISNRVDQKVLILKQAR